MLELFHLADPLHQTRRSKSVIAGGILNAKRTNDFQELVVLVQKALAPEGAVVTESALVDTGTEGETREIDCLMDTKVGEYRIKIAIEAKDEARPMDITRFESIAGKYIVEGGLKVNKIVIITHNGFTQSVIDRAKRLEIDLLTLREAKQFDWSQFKPPGPSFKCLLEIKNVKLNPDIGNAAEKNDLRIVCSCGKNHGTPIEFAKQGFWQFAAQSKGQELSAIDNDAFTKDEIKKTAVTITEANDPNHQRFILLGEKRDKLVSTSFEIHFQKPPRIEPAHRAGFSYSTYICGVGLIPPPPTPATAGFMREARIVCSCCGKDHGMLSDYINKGMSDHIKPTSQAQILLRNAVTKSPNGIAHLHAMMQLPDKWRVVHAETSHKADQIRVQIHGEKGDQMEMKQFELTNVDGSSRRICHFEASVGGKTMRIIMPDGLQSKKITLKFGDKTKSKGKRNRSKKRRK